MTMYLIDHVLVGLIVLEALFTDHEDASPAMAALRERLTYSSRPDLSSGELGLSFKVEK